VRGILFDRRRQTGRLQLGKINDVIKKNYKMK
jgi:hypothetical protein